MKGSMLCVAALIALLGGPALAADLPRKALPPEPPPAPTWAGFYIGIHGGWGQADVEHRFVDVGFFNLNPGDRVSHDIDGALVGGHIGYNWQWAGTPWVFGFEVAGTWSDIRGEVPSPFFPLVDRFHADIDWLVTFTPRVGVSAGNWMVYVKGGLAVADITARISTLAFVPPLAIEESETRSGWTVGGGFEVMTGATWPFGGGGSWVFGVEGNYYDFGDLTVLRTLDPPFTNHHVDVTMWSVLGRLSWKFGAAPAPVIARY
jgi:outer membrane immunogenic protein